MEYNTSALCDTYLDLVDVVEPMFSHFGAKTSFSGQITTVKCFEDNELINQLLSEKGEGRVLLIDGGGSLRRALIDADLAAKAAHNGWEGLIVYGCVREIDYLEEIDIGIQALAPIPINSEKKGTGDVDIAVNFGGVTFLPEDYIYADSTGVIISQEPLEELNNNEEE